MALEKQENQINVNKSCSSCGCSNVAAQDFSVASEPRVNKT
ncbi:cation transporter, partial [Acinetobacter baumannii]|nr:cation transporter [Acinetobacter baumannii]